nr:hypothetical protein [uncultured Flavobacterium sp.]
MKKISIYIFITSLLNSCESKDSVEITQMQSKEMVTILPNLKNPLIKDSIPISIPSEFEIKINSPVHYINWFYHVDGKTLRDDSFDYQVYNKKNKSKPIHQLDFDESFNENKITIIIKERNHLISKKDAQELLKKYNINRSLDNLKFRDTIKLTFYDKFQKENKEMIDNFNKINDSIYFRGMKEDGSFFYVDKKISW